MDNNPDQTINKTMKTPVPATGISTLTKAQAGWGEL